MSPHSQTNSLGQPRSRSVSRSPTRYQEPRSENVILMYGRDEEEEEEEENVASSTLLSGKPSIRGRSKTWKLILLTVCLAGLQFTWTVEMGYGTPYLISLGLPKSRVSLVWLAGPLSGLIMQPIIGALSDKCTSRWGRRRPFIVGGSLIVVVTFFTIGWTKWLTSWFVGDSKSELFQNVAIGIAVTSIYVLDFAINTVQASTRALIVDSLPPSQQEDGTAWASRMVGIGSVVGYYMGYVDLVVIFPFFGKTQLKVLCVLASIALLTADAITCWAVSERVYISESRSNSTGGRHNLLAAITIIFSRIRNLPRPFQQLCNVQLFAWIGWFPFLFYSTTWVAEIYKRTSSAEEFTDDMAARAGSFAFLLEAIIALISSFVLPFLIAPNGSGMYSNTRALPTKPGCTNIFGRLPSLPISFLTLRRAWTFSLIIFFLMMMSTYLVDSVNTASLAIGLCGISWAVSTWAPFSIMGEYISKQAQVAAGDHISRLNEHSMVIPRASLSIDGAGIGVGDAYPLLATAMDEGVREIVVDEDIEDISQHDLVNANEETVHSKSSRHFENRDTNQRYNDHELSSTTGDSAGILLGIHNVYVVIPQFIVTFISSIVFYILEPHGATSELAGSAVNATTGLNNDDGLVGDGVKIHITESDPIGVIFRIGGLAAGVAAYFSLKLWKEE